MITGIHKIIDFLWYLLWLLLWLPSFFLFGGRIFLRNVGYHSRVVAQTDSTRETKGNDVTNFFYLKNGLPSFFYLIFETLVISTSKKRMKKPFFPISYFFAPCPLEKKISFWWHVIPSSTKLSFLAFFFFLSP